MADVVYVNEAEGLKRVVNNKKLYVKLLTQFRTGYNLDDLLALSEAEEWEKAQAAAHTIKGIAANLSLTELFNQSLAVETQIKGKSLNPESLESLKLCFAETLTAVDEVIAQYA
jgi:HPt (histidine-containing phosphotransfer) domain-containing protein